MLIIPLHRRLGADNLPWMTLALILANCFVFAFLQSGDEAALARASSYYRQSGLAALELPLFFAHLRANGQADEAAELERMDEPERTELSIRWMARDLTFQQQLADGAVVAPTHPEFAHWQQRRHTYEQLYAEQVTERHLLHFADTRPSQLFTAMFLHADAGHLIGNMVFLLLLGLLTEGALGAPLFLALYLLAGIGGGGLSLLRHAGEIGGALGASGAIAGLMGAFCVLWGLRKVRVFYWFFIVFDYAKVPALALLPFWLGWELYNLHAHPEAGIGFDAHAGGILCGALLAFGVRRLGWERREFLDQPEHDENDAALRAQVRSAIGQLEFTRARVLLERLLPRAPADRELLQWQYRAWRTEPGHASFHAAARALLLDPHGVGRHVAEHEALFDDYLAATVNKPRLSATELLALCRRWLAAHRHARSERVLSALAQRQPQLDGLAAVWIDLLLAYRTQGDAGAVARVRHAIARYFPDSPQALKAGQIEVGG